MRVADDPLESFAALPKRLFLDSSTLQTILRYGEFIFENVDPPPGDRAHRVPGAGKDIDALRHIFQVSQRASFDIVLSKNSLQEVLDKHDVSAAGRRLVDGSLSAEAPNLRRCASRGIS